MLENLKNAITYSVFIVIPVYSWYTMIKCYFKLKKKQREREIFKDRHCCVVRYRGRTKMVGWPHYKQLEKMDFNAPFLPLIYFIETAEHKIDIAVMALNANCIINTLLNAYKRGVSIRIIVDFKYTGSHLKELQKAGIPICYFVNPNEADYGSIFHYKYALKDDNFDDKSGFLCVGSINWVADSFYQNYENLCFFTDFSLLSNFRKNFDETWDTIKNINSNNNYVKAVLKGTIRADG